MKDAVIRSYLPLRVDGIIWLFDYDTIIRLRVIFLLTKNNRRVSFFEWETNLDFIWNFYVYFNSLQQFWNFSISNRETKSRPILRYIPVECLEWSDTSIVRHWPRSPLFPRFSELEDRSHRIVRPFSLSHAGYPRSRASYTRITWRGSRPRVRWPAALQGRPRAMLPNTTSDDAANAAIIAGPILWRRPACGENGTLYRPGATLITRVKLSPMLNFTD